MIISFFSYFFFFLEPADYFNIREWVEWVDATFFCLAKQGEMPGNYLLDPRDLGKPHARAKGLQ